MKKENMINSDIYSEYGVAAAIEAKRLAEKYQKDYFDCDDLVKVMGVGKKQCPAIDE